MTWVTRELPHRLWTCLLTYTCLYVRSCFGPVCVIAKALGRVWGRERGGGHTRMASVIFPPTQNSCHAQFRLTSVNPGDSPTSPALAFSPPHSAENTQISIPVGKLTSQRSRMGGRGRRVRTWRWTIQFTEIIQLQLTAPQKPFFFILLNITRVTTFWALKCVWKCVSRRNN